MKKSLILSSSLAALRAASMGNGVLKRTVGRIDNVAGLKAALGSESVTNNV